MSADTDCQLLQIDTLDLGNVLLWVLGSLLVVFWLVYLVKRESSYCLTACR